MSEVLNQLVEMSRVLGDPANDLVILEEGSAAAGLEDGTFWVKASGAQLANADASSFVRVRSETVLSGLGQHNLSDDEVRRLLGSATVDSRRPPPIETFFHAPCLQLDGVNFVGHTHPTAVMALLSSRRSRELFSGALFPDQIVQLGSAYVMIPYTDPGLPLARAVHDAIQEFVDRKKKVPKVVLMENHGVIVLGSTAPQVESATKMLVKTCRILSGTLPAGGPRFLAPEHAQRIDSRPDERSF
jgi:rhamnose utilization protein RhaD (predicted bifunctional aldolase and dehydrogenase)